MPSKMGHIGNGNSNSNSNSNSKSKKDEGRNVYLPPELSIINMDFKKKIEMRDECLIDTSPTKLRNGKLLYYTNSRINRFMNDASYLINTVKKLTTKVTKLCDLIFHYYYFIETNQENIIMMNDEKLKNNFNVLVKNIKSKILDFQRIFQDFNHHQIRFVYDCDKQFCLYWLNKCQYFIDNMYDIEKGNCPSNTPDNLHTDLKFYCQ